MSAPRNPVLVARRAPAAVLAGLLWLVALGLVARIPAAWREAHLYRAYTSEGVKHFQVLVLWVGAIGLLGVAHGLSTFAHGGWLRAARVVLGLRAATWLLVAGVLVAGIVVGIMTDSSCWRSCAPFPR